MPLTAALNHPDRLADLLGSGLLDSLPEEAFDRYVRLGGAFLAAPILLVSLVAGDRQFFKGHCGLPASIAANPQTPLTHSFCKFVVHSEQPLVICDARREPLVQDNPAVAELGVIAYLGIPIRSGAGRVMGSFCAIDREPRIWTDHDIAIMTDLAAAISTEIQLRAAQAEVEALRHQGAAASIFQPARKARPSPFARRRGN